MSSTSSSTTTTRGISTLGLLGIVLVLLKAFSVIQISWLWALAPFWIPFVIAALVLLMVGVVMLIVIISDIK